jgi:predicted nucleic acid-binding protein
VTAIFLDTSVLIYAYSTDDQAKWQVATALLADGGHVSVQCLNEFASVARRKLGFDWAEIATASADIVDLCHSVVPVTQGVHRRGLSLAKTYNLALHDAVLVAAAIEAGADILYSEDMHNSLVVDGRVTIRNPFA